jgi:hypothetical protein
MRDMKILKTAFVLILIGADAFAQQKATPGDESNWVRFESPAHDLSVSLPETGYLVDNEDGAYRLHFLSTETVIRVDMTPTSDAKDDFKLSYKFEEEKGYTFFEIGDFFVGQFIGENKKPNQYVVWLHLASLKGSYLVTANTKDPSNSVLKRFIDSIRLNGKTLYTPRKAYPVEAQTVLISSLRSDPIILEALRKPDSKQKRLEKAKNTELEQDDEKHSYSRPLVLLRKPKVRVGSAWGRVINGTVKVIVTFLANGEVGNVVLLKSLDPALDQDAAKKIKFLPAEIDGKAVDVSKIVEYSFSVY